MEYGIFTSPTLEIAQTRFWSLCLSCDQEKTFINAELYKGVDIHKTLIAVVCRDMTNQITKYAYETPDGKTFSNDDICLASLGKQYDYITDRMVKNDTIELVEPYAMSAVSERGISYCLKQWRMGSFYDFSECGMQFLLVTNKVEYVFFVQQENTNIYCGASVNIPLDNGMLGSGQYFRIRNYGENTQPFCSFFCDLGNKLSESEAYTFKCETGKCMQTPQGIFWPVKHYDDNMIVLSGCGGDEYRYERNSNRSEYFYVEK